MDSEKGHIVEVVVAPALPAGTTIDLAILREELSKISGVTWVAGLDSDEIRLHFNQAEARRTVHGMRMAVYTAYSRAAERTRQSAPPRPRGGR